MFVPGEGNGNQLQYSCLGNPMDGGAWRAADQGVAKSWTRLGTCQQQVVFERHFNFVMLLYVLSAYSY